MEKKNLNHGQTILRGSPLIATTTKWPKQKNSKMANKDKNTQNYSTLNLSNDISMSLPRWRNIPPYPNKILDSSILFTLFPLRNQQTKPQNGKNLSSKRCMRNEGYFKQGGAKPFGDFNVQIVLFVSSRAVGSVPRGILAPFCLEIS